MLTSIPLFGPIPGGPELIIILAVIVLLFGANKIPKLARASGQAMGEFRRGREEIEADIKQAAASSQTDVDEDESATAPDERAAVVDDLSTDRHTEKAT